MKHVGHDGLCPGKCWMAGAILVENSFIHSVFRLTTGPKPPPKRCLHIVRSRASSFKWQYPLLSLRSSSSFLRLLATSISPFIFPSITCFRRQFLRKMWPIQLAFRFPISCRIFLCSLTLNNTSSFLTWSVQLIFSILLQHHISKLSRYFWSAARSVQVSVLPPYIIHNGLNSKLIHYLTKQFTVFHQRLLHVSAQEFWNSTIKKKEVTFDLGGRNSSDH